MSGWKKKQKPSDLSSSQPTASGVLSPLEMFRLGTSTQKRSKIKGVDSTVPFAQANTLIDLSLATKGNMEDRDFAEDPMLRLNLRRGNTLAVVLNPIERGKFVEDSRIYMEKGCPYEISRVEWVRKGMRKFFDMCLPYVQQTHTQNLDGLGSFGGNYAKQFRGRDEYMEELRKVIFFEVEQTFLRDRAQIDVYKTNKANGENAQVSYSARIGAWIIASKNVSLAARTPEDISTYNLSRFDFAKLIAIEWFRLISPLTPVQLESLKCDLNNRTIVGEYVGHPDHQHLVRYTEKDIMFYAYVDHDREDTCLPPVQAFRLFRKYGLSHVKVDLYGSYHSPSELYSSLESLFMKTSSEDISEGEEGSVLYFVRNTAVSAEQKTVQNAVFSKDALCEFPSDMEARVFAGQTTLSLAKLKTLEYRIYRKLREKLKHFSTDKTPESVLRVFKNEMRELCEGHELPKPAEFYHEIARVALQFISKTPKAGEKLQEHYIDFLDKIIAKVSDSSDPSSDPSQTPSSSSAPIEIVLITPPELFTDEQLQSLASNLSYTLQTVRDWRENRNPKEKAIFRLFHAQRVDSQFDRMAIIVHLGFTEAGKQGCLQAISRLSASGVRVDNDEIKRYVESQDLVARVEALWSDVGQRKEHMMHVYPENFVEAGEWQEAEILIARKLEELQRKTVMEIPKSEAEDRKETIPAGGNQAIAGKRVMVILPMGIPGMGKTFLISQLQAISSSLNFSLSVVSSDQVRRECMDEWLAKNHSTNLDKAFESTAKRARTVFFDRVKENMRSNSAVHVLFIDKNHPPNAIAGTLEEVSKGKPKDVKRVEVVALVPECREKMNVRKGNGVLEYEMSMTFLVQCMLRTRDRPTHETLIGSPAKLLSVVLMMFAMYRNTHFQDYLRQGIDYLIRMPFTDESTVYFPEGLVSALSDLLSNLKPGSLPEEADVRPIVDALQHIPNTFSRVDNCDKAIEAFTALIRRSGADAPIRSIEKTIAVEESKTVPVEKTEMRLDVGTRQQTDNKPGTIDPRKIPVFLGIDVEDWFGPCVLGLLRASLFTLSEIFTTDEPVTRDYADLMENQYAPQFAAAQQVSSAWAYPNSLHLTTKFIGGNRQAMSLPQVSGFRVNEDVTLRVKMVAYVPRKIICVLCEVLTAGIAVENKFPHITCLLSDWKPKNSNDVLNGISFESNAYKQRATICGEDVFVYTIRLLPEWILRGKTKAYY